MSFVPKKTKQKEKASYKTLYISQKLIDRVTAIAQQYDTSFNNVVISMIEQCLEENDDKK
ncbi:hypothetical protein [Anaerotruncus rubiinfantis]|uniref:hypothetical protein n=1 Tax=Anaerotruncus rubiinfantis TaxID=1720200 RepID=UPI00082C51F8|nr:hypothetical protein [Anaerotruncus rubiinfantis]